MSDAPRKIRVAYVINSILAAGAETMVLEVVSHLDKTKFEPIVYALRDYGKERTSLLKRFEDASVPVVFLKPEARLGIFDSLFILRRLFLNKRPDVVHCHLPDAVIAGGISAMLTRVPFIIHEHQAQKFHSWKIRLLYRLVRPFAAVSLCYALSIEEAISGSAVLLKNSPQRLDRKTYTIYNGIDVHTMEQFSLRNASTSKRRELGYADTDIVIISVARFVEWKGQRLLLDAFASITQSAPHTRLLLVGEGPLLKELHERVVELGLRDRVQMLGVRTDVYELLLASDIFSLAFTYEHADGEAIGIAGFEAMAAGLPVIISDYTSAGEHVRDGVTGLIVRPYDKEALATALTRLVEDASLREEMGRAAHLYAAQNLDWNDIIGTYEGIYRIIANI